MATIDPDPRGQKAMIGTRRFPGPVSFDDLVPLDFKRISLIRLFDRMAVLADVESDFESLSLHAWDGEFFWGVDTESLASRVYQWINTVDDIDLANYGTVDVKRSRYVAAVAKGFQMFAGAPAVDKGFYVELWRYKVSSERPYVANLCTFTEEDIFPWRGRYMLHADVLCWGRSICKAEFRYVSRA